MAQDTSTDRCTYLVLTYRTNKTVTKIIHKHRMITKVRKCVNSLHKHRMITKTASILKEGSLAYRRRQKTNKPVTSTEILS